MGSFDSLLLQYWNKGPVFVNSVLQKACCFWEGLCAERNRSSGESLLVFVGSTVPFPSAVTWQLCSRSPAESQVTRREEPGSSSLAPLQTPGLHCEVWDTGFRLQFSKVLKLLGRCKHRFVWQLGWTGRMQGCGLLLGLGISGPRLGLLLVRAGPVRSWLRGG